MSIIPIPSQSPVNQEPPPHYDYLPCYNELFKTYETERLILKRVDQYDIEPLAKIILNKKIIEFYHSKYREYHIHINYNKN